jgi:hypothetical protein
MDRSLLELDSDYTGCLVRAGLDDIEETVTIDFVGPTFVTIVLTFEEWDAIVKVVAKARKAGAR